MCTFPGIVDTQLILTIANVIDFDTFKVKLYIEKTIQKFTSAFFKDFF